MEKLERDMLEIDIAAYLDGRLTGEEREALERRLLEDSEEGNILAIAKGILRDQGEHGDVPEHLMQKARELYPRETDIFDLVVSLAGSALSIISVSPEAGISGPAEACAVRRPEAGTFSHVVLTRVFHHARVDVYVERMAGNTCTFTVKATDPAMGTPIQAARVELVSGRRELASNPLEQGAASFEELRIGSYAVTIRKQENIIGRMSVKITGV